MWRCWSRCGTARNLLAAHSTAHAHWRWRRAARGAARAGRDGRATAWRAAGRDAATPIPHATRADRHRGRSSCSALRSRLVRPGWRASPTLACRGQRAPIPPIALRAGGRQRETGLFARAIADAPDRLTGGPRAGWGRSSLPVPHRRGRLSDQLTPRRVAGERWQERCPGRKDFGVRRACDTVPDHVLGLAGED